MKKKHKSNSHGGGPKTDAGKAIVKFNSVKHGLFGTQAFLLPDESQEYFELIRKGLRDTFHPADFLESRLCEELAWVELRLERMRRHERSMCDENRRHLRGVAVREFATCQINKMPSNEILRETTAMPLGDTALRLMKQEGFLARRRDKLVETLERRRAARKNRRSHRAAPEMLLMLGDQTNSARPVEARIIKALPAPTTIIESATPAESVFVKSARKQR